MLAVTVFLQSGDCITVELDGSIFFRGRRVEPNEEGFVSIDGINNGKPVKAASIVVYAHKKCKLPLFFIGRIVPLFHDGDEKNLFPVNLEYRYDSPVEHPLAAGFFFIPYFNSQLISRDAQVYSLDLRKNLNQYITPERGGTKNGYKRVNILLDQGSRRSYLVHRLLGLTFLEYTADVHKRVINHKNGDGGHNTVENIEWTTRAGNNKHARDTKLNHCGAKAVLAKDLKTGIVTRYESLNDVTKALGYTDIAGIQRRLYKAPERVYSDFIALKLDDGTPWREYDLTGRVSTRHNATRIVCKNVFDGSIHIASNYNTAAQATGVATMSVLKAIRDKRDLPIKGWLFKDCLYYDDAALPEFNVFDLRLFKEKIDSLPKFAYIVLKDGKEDFYSSATTVTQTTGLSRDIVLDLSAKGKSHDGFEVFRYYPTGSTVKKTGNIYQGRR